MYSPHLLQDDPGVGGGLADVVAGALVPALHHVRQHQDQAVLHLGDGLPLLLDLADVVHGVAGGLGQGLVEVLDLVSGADIQAVEGLDAVLPGLLAVVSEAPGGDGHAVDGQDHAVLRQPQHQHQDKEEKAHKEGGDADHEVEVVDGELAHGDVHAGVALAVALGVIDGLVDGQEVG